MCRQLFILTCHVFLLLGHGLLAKTIFVDDNASEGGDGTSWSTAYKYLQDALAVAESGDEIWVAEGTYKPDQGTGQTIGDKSSSFILVNGVGVYGGFLGSETKRDPQGNSSQTILSGEISEDSELWCDHVLMGAYLDANTTLDGFKITNGNPRQSGFSGSTYYQIPENKGAGMYLLAGNMTLSNLVFVNNIGDDIYHAPSNSTLTIINCEFLKEESLQGSGVYVSGTNSGSLFLKNCKFAKVEALGAVIIDITGYEDNFTLEVNNCEFTDNKQNGIYYIKSGEEPLDFIDLTNCRFLNNGNRGLHYQTSFPDRIRTFTLESCSFENNKGGGIFFSIEDADLYEADENTTVSINNCQFSENNDSAIYFDGNSISFANCLFEGNKATYGGALYGIFSSKITLEDCNFSYNEAVEEGGAIFGAGGSYFDTHIILTNCEFKKNKAESGGGIYFSNRVGYDDSDGSFTKSFSTIESCKFYDNNSTGGEGGAINCALEGSFEISKSIFESNSAITQVSSAGLYGGMGGGLYLETTHPLDSNFSITSCVFSKNTVGEYGGGGAFYLRNSEGPLLSDITNCIFEGNEGGNEGVLSFDIDQREDSAQNLKFTNCVFAKNVTQDFASGGILIYKPNGVINFGQNPLTSLSMRNCISWNNYTYINDNLTSTKVGQLEGHGIDGAAYTYPSSSANDLKEVLGISNIFQGSSTGMELSTPNFQLLNDTSMDNDPLFANIDNPVGPDGIWFTEDDGLRVLQGSPAIDAGTEVDSSIEYDIAGSDRRLGGAIDIGAYEYVEGSSSSSSSSGDGVNNQSEGNGSNDSQNSSNKSIASSVVYSSDGSRWVELDWFGYFFDSSNVVSSMKGWVFHEDLGWLYATFSSNEKAWVWTQKNGWLWTSNSVYPYLYSSESTNWIYVLSESQTDVKVFDYRPNEWTTWQDLTLLRMADSDPTISQSNSAQVEEIKSVIDSSESNEKKITTIAEIIRSNL